MNLNYLPVPFRGTTQYLVEHQGQPYVAMKSLVEGMGLDWSTQLRKLNTQAKRWGIVMMTIPFESNGQEMVCMALKKLLGWLMTINPGKVKPEIRATIEAYQAECDEVLWQYWTQGHAVNPRIANLPPPALVREVRKGNLVAAEILTRDYGLGEVVQVQLAKNRADQIAKSHARGFFTLEEQRQQEREYLQRTWAYH